MVFACVSGVSAHHCMNLGKFNNGMKLINFFSHFRIPCLRRIHWTQGVIVEITVQNIGLLDCVIVKQKQIYCVRTALSE